MFVKSKYNYNVEYKDYHLVYNGISNTCVILNREEFVEYDNFSDSSNTDSNTELFDEMVRLGVYVDDSINETKRFTEKSKHLKKNNKLLYFRIYTTTACNARCFYCFEKNVAKNEMTYATAENVLHFIASKYSEQREICIEWFGGEPLLNTDIIDYISSRVKVFADRVGAKYWSRIVTNGSRLDRISEEKFKSWNISHVQVTIDGIGEKYNAIKGYTDSTTFEKVISNLKYIQSMGIKITIRINYSNDNISDCISLIEYLDKCFEDKKRIRISWKRIMQSDTDNSLKYTYDADELFFDKCLECGFIKNIERTINSRYIGCVAQNSNAYMIMPDGSYGKCSQAMAENDFLGNINSNVEENVDKWSESKLDEKCEACALLPLCNGGCTYEKMKDKEYCMISWEALQHKLKVLLKKELGVEQSEEETLKYLTKAKDNGNEETLELLRKESNNETDYFKTVDVVI